MPSRLLLTASLSGFLAVVLGAFGAHGLEDRLTPDSLATFNTAVDYHMYHSLALLALVPLLQKYQDATVLKLAALLFILGILIFSGSLYLLSLSGITWLGAVTPIGGLGFLAAWGCLFRFAFSLETA